MSEYAGIRLSWERVIAAAKNLPDPASVSQEMQVEQDNNRQERYLLFALENIFTITSQGNDLKCDNMSYNNNNNHNSYWLHSFHGNHDTRTKSRLSCFHGVSKTCC